MVEQTFVVIDYTNYKGERRIRTIQPHSIWFGESEYHKDGKQWFLRATDRSREKLVIRDFAMKDIHSWSPDQPTAAVYEPYPGAKPLSQMSYAEMRKVYPRE